MKFIIRNNILHGCFPEEGDTEAVIPEGVTGTYGNVLRNNNSITKITLPDTMTEIGDSAFFYAFGLREINIPDSVTVIGADAFNCCQNLRTIIIPAKVHYISSFAFYGCTSLTDVTVKGNISNIGYGAFLDCRNLVNVSFHGTVNEIGNRAFGICEKLPEFVIPDGVKKIGLGAFEFCETASELHIPASVKAINSQAFCGCTNLSRITVDEKNKHYDSRGGCNAIIRTADNTLISGCKTTVIPETVKTIWQYAFRDTEDLREINIPASVNTIYSTAFDRCDNLTKMYIKSGNIKLTRLPHLRETAVNGFCSAYREYRPDAAKSYLRAFPETITAAIENDNDDFIQFAAELGRIKPGNFMSDFFEPAEKHNAVMCKAFLLDWKNRNIPADYFEKEAERALKRDPFNVADMRKQWNYTNKEDGTIGLIYIRNAPKDVYIPDHIGRKKVTSIGCFALNNYMHTENYADRIEYISVPSSITETGFSSFSNCRNLIKADINASLEKLSDQMFYDCIKLSTVTLPDSLKVIGQLCFGDCVSLKGINIPPAVVRIEIKAFEGCIQLTSVTLPDTVTAIKDYAFADCRNLRDIFIPNSAVFISDNAFEDCNNLVISCHRGSLAEAYAERMQIPCRIV